MSLLRELQALEKAVRLGGQKALEMRSSIKPADIIAKGGDPRDVLTKADPAVQAVMFDHLGKVFRGVPLIGEEEQSRAEQEQLAKGDEFFVGDPIDGTTNYTHPTSFKWGTTAALVRDHEVVLGAIFLPPINVMITAAKGEGCFINGKRQYISHSIPLEQAIVGMEWSFFDDELWHKQRRVVDAIRGVHTNQSAVYSIYELIRGEIDAYVNLHLPERGACVWDFAAGHLSLQEMVVPEDRDNVAFFPDGAPLSYEGRIGMEALLCPYPALARQIIDRLK